MRYNMAMSARLHTVVINSEQPDRLVGFWGAVLGVEVSSDEPSAGITWLHPDRPGGVAVAIQRVAEKLARHTETHVDIGVDDLDDAQAIVQVERLSVRFPVRKGVLLRTTGYFEAVRDVSFDLFPGRTPTPSRISWPRLGSGPGSICRTCFRFWISEYRTVFRMWSPIRWPEILWSVSARVLSLVGTPRSSYFQSGVL